MNPFETARRLADAHRPFAAAVLLTADGSTPREAGARAVIEPSGRIHGTLGGGAVEAAAQRLAVEACRTGRAVLADFRLDDASPDEPGPICGGTVRLLVHPAAAHRDAFAAAADALRNRRAGLLLTTIAHGEPPAVSVAFSDAEHLPAGTPFPGRDALAERLRRRTPRLFSKRPADPAGRPTETFVEPVLPAPRLLIVGAGHIGHALARRAPALGFEVTVLDDRPDFADPARFDPAVRVLPGPIAENLARCRPDEETFIVIVTRGHRHDADALAACIASPAAYIGMIGSRRKVAMLREQFLRAGRASEAQWRRVFAPVGLDIGAETVEEIVTSIAAQLVLVRRRGPRAAPTHMTAS